MRKTDSTDAFVRFDEFENRIERMEATANLVNVPVKPDLEEEFRKMKSEDAVEQELQALKQSLADKKSVANAGQP